MTTTHDLPKELLEVFEYNPFPITCSPISRDEREPHRTLPFDFYDRHLAPHLSLKRVVVDRSIPASLVSNIDATLETFRSDGHHFVHLDYATAGDCSIPDLTIDRWHWSRPRTDQFVYQYEETIGCFIPAFISTWLIHPTAQKYFSTLTFSERERIHPSFEDFVHPHHSFRFKSFEQQQPEVLSLISDQLKDALESLQDKDLIIYQFYHMTTEMEQIFKDMDLLETNLPSAVYKSRGLVEKKTPCETPPCDAIKPPWTLPSCSDTERLAVVQHVGDQKVTPRASNGKTTFDAMDAQTAAGLCYHAWHRAVIEDATLLVFHCGNYERIGIRHRETQTLILSGLIEVSKCQSPAYGKIHVGLLLAAVNDALDRYQQSRLSAKPSLSPALPAPSPTKRRKRNSVSLGELRRSKRQKIKAQMASLPQGQVEDDQIFWKSYTGCQIALVRLDFGPFRSSSPAACLRVGGPLSPHGGPSLWKTWKESYKPLECCTLTIESDLTRGGTGRVHSARLEVRIPDGLVRYKDVIVKTAIEPRLRKRLRREYNVYCRLWQHKVDRIPISYGLFDDMDDMATLLVIEKFNTSFRDREPFDSEGSGKMLTVSRAERSLCLKTIRAMHKAGVAHFDFRAENIMIGHDGLPVIIDFDRSWLGAQKWAINKEVRFVQDLLDGRICEEFPVAVDSDAE